MSDAPAAATKIVVPGPEGASDEVFESQEALIEGKRNATMKIRQQSEELEAMRARLAALEAEPDAEPVQPSPAGFSRESYFNTLSTDPMAAFDLVFEQRFGMKPDEAAQQWSQMSEATSHLQLLKIGQDFRNRHPEVYAGSPEDQLHNNRIIEQVMEANGWEPNANLLHAAYLEAKESGKLRLPAPPPAPGSTTMPPEPPATLTSTGGSPETVDEAKLLADVKTWPLEKQREFYQSRRAAFLAQRQ